MSAVCQSVNHFDHFDRSAYCVSEDWHERRGVQIRISLLSDSHFPMSINPLACAPFPQYDPQLLQSYISASLLADLGIFMSAATVFHNILLSIAYVSTDTSLWHIYVLFSSLCTTPYHHLVLIYTFQYCMYEGSGRCRLEQAALPDLCYIVKPKSEVLARFWGGVKHRLHIIAVGIFVSAFM